MLLYRQRKRDIGQPVIDEIIMKRPFDQLYISQISIEHHLNLKDSRVKTS
jgi:hypothetical protein